MAPGISHCGPVAYDVIHFSDRFPVVATPCGRLGPSAGLWRYVTCIPCLEAAPDDPRIKRRLDEVQALRGEHLG